MAARWFGKLAFITVQDASGRLQLQLSAHGTNGAKGMAVDNAVASARKTIDIGDIVCATGTAMKRTNKGEVSLVVENLELLTKAVRPLPEKYHGLVDVEKRYRHRALDLIMNERSRMILRLRSAVMSQTRQFLERRNFSEMETPMLHQRAGGAAARPFTTKHHALGCNFQLRIATELHLKQLLVRLFAPSQHAASFPRVRRHLTRDRTAKVGGFEKIFELGRVLRNEGISQRHNPEFTSLEVYEAYADYTDMAELLENLVGKLSPYQLCTPIYLVYSMQMWTVTRAAQ
jgi:lysyl-tRNA synthetase class 2